MPTLHYDEAKDRVQKGLILGLAAKKQRGKDTMADWLVAEEQFTKLAFAEPMYRCAAAAIGCSPELLADLKEQPHVKIALGIEYEGLGFIPDHQFTVRQYLQWVGTEAHRAIPEFGDTVWIDMMRAKLAQPGRYVITDARFENEQRMIKDLGGYVIQINRPGMDEGDGHASEQVDHGLADYVIENDGDLAAYAGKIVATLADIRRVRAL